MSAPDLLEWVLLVTALFGVWHHARHLRMLCRRCRGALPWAEAIICAIYQRSERIRVVVKLALAGVAVWMISQPTPLMLERWGMFGVMYLRVSLIAVALMLDWESLRASHDRYAIGKRARAERRAAITRRGRTGDI